MTLTRKEFLSSVVGVLAGATGAALLVGCGGDDGGSTGIDAAGASCTTNGTTSVIGTNHGHTLTVSKEDVVAAADKTYDIKGSSGHTHSVTITAALFAMLKNNTGVMSVSTAGGGDGHTHTVTVTCA